MCSVKPSSMPPLIYVVSYLIPVVGFMVILRGAILRSAGVTERVSHVIGMWVCCVTIPALSVARFRRQLD